MTLRVIPEGLASASAAVEALTARLAAAHDGLFPDRFKRLSAQGVPAFGIVAMIRYQPSRASRSEHPKTPGPWKSRPVRSAYASSTDPTGSRQRR